MTVSDPREKVNKKFQPGVSKGWGCDPLDTISTPPPAKETASGSKQWGKLEDPTKSVAMLFASKKLLPKISTITPILSPPSGIPITITGTDFEKTVIIKVGNIPGHGETTYIQKDGVLECA